MSTLRRLLFFGILCFGLHFANGRVGKIVHESYIEGVDSNLYVNINAFWSKDNLQNLTYVTCPGSGSKFQRNCTVGSRAVSLACPVTLNADQSRTIEDYLEVFPFGPTRAIIFWGDYYGPGQRTHVKCTVVDLMTCQSNYLEFPMASKLPYDFILAKSNYVIHENSFEFMITDNSHSRYLNKYNINVNGTLISKLEPWCRARQMMNSAHPVVIDKEIKSYLYTSTSEDQIFRQWILAKCNGAEKLLQQVKPNFFGPLIEDVSTTHNTIGIATGSDSSILVGQFDLDGNPKLNMTLDFDFDLGSVSMLNLAAGGFVLTVEGTKLDSKYGYESKQPKMLKISADKKIIGSVKWMKHIYCDNKITMQLFENEAKEHCLAILCTNVRRFNTGWTEGKQFAELEVRCYTDSDFTTDDTPVYRFGNDKLFVYKSFGEGFYLHKCNGSEILLTQVSTASTSSLRQDISTTYNTIGLVLGGNLMLNMRFNFNFEVRIPSAFNLPNGGFVLIFDKSDHSDLEMLKVSGDQIVIRAVTKIERNDSRGSTMVQLVENDAKEYCFAVLCRDLIRKYGDVSTLPGIMVIIL